MANQAGYSSEWLAVWRAVVQDYLRGEGHRARARLGFLSPPEDRGRVIWVRSGATPESLRLGIDLVGTIRERRKDVRIVFTFEREDRDVLEAEMKAWPKVGIGYGPSDRPRVVSRVLQRFQPCGVVLADCEPPAELLRQIKAPVVAIGGRQDLGRGDGRGITLAWPLNAMQARIWEARENIEALAPADPEARFAEAQADVVLRSLVGEKAGRIWRWHGSPDDWVEFKKVWSAAEDFHGDILMVSTTGSRPPAAVDLRVSDWDRRPLSPGTIMHINDVRWFAASATAAAGVHLQEYGRRVLWQAMAAGSALSLGQDRAGDDWPVPVLAQPPAVFGYWRSLRKDEASRRRQGDAARRRFWEERRRVDANSARLLAVVWEW
jgi:hypothetical protein